jgi:phosphoglycerate dehydrogenase-like enzyme
VSRPLNVLVTMPFGEALLDRIRRVSTSLTVTSDTPERADYSGTEVLYAGSLPVDRSRAPRLEWVQLHMAGVNTLHQHPLFLDPTVTLTTASGVHAATIAEYAMTVMLALAHRVPRMIEWQRRGCWPPDEERWPLFLPKAIHGATLGIVGYGSIGRELARIAKAAFGMQVLACKRDPTQRADLDYCRPGTGDPAGELPDTWLSPGELPQLLAESDVVVMSVPLTAATRGMLGERELGLMKPTAYLINVGRGATLDEAALARAVAARRIAGAAVDVFAQEPPPAGHPLYALDDVIVSPHVSGFLSGFDDWAVELFAENLRRYLAGQPLCNRVDRARGY